MPWIKDTIIDFSMEHNIWNRAYIYNGVGEQKPNYILIHFTYKLNSLFLIFMTEIFSRNNNFLKTFFKKGIFANYLFSISWFPFGLFAGPFKKKFKQSFLFVYFLVVFNIDFDGYFILRTDEGQPRLKYIFNKIWN